MKPWMPACAGMTSEAARVRGGFRVALFQNVIPANAGIQRLQRHASMKPWMPACAGMTGEAAFASPFKNVIPANAGIQRLQSHALMKPWMPACAGMTG